MHLPKAHHSRLAAAVLISTLSLSAAWIQTPQALAHKVEVIQNVGGTLHIEPNDTPRAGEEVLAWVALTRPGGQPISLAECDCQISLYRQPELGDDPPIFSSVPFAVKGDASGEASDIPGIKLTFPEVGSYNLVISGQPKTTAAESSQRANKSFAPFELAFEVTVATGDALPTIPADETAALPAPNRQSSPPSTTLPPADNRSRQILPWMGLGTVILVAWAAFGRRH
jgi:hypothetical protein